MRFVLLSLALSVAVQSAPLAANGGIKHAVHKIEHKIEHGFGSGSASSLLPRQLDLDNTLNQLEKGLNGKQMYQLKRLINEIENQKRNGGSSDIIRQLENELFGLISKLEGGEVNGDDSLKKELKQLEHEIEGKDSKSGLLNILPRQLDLDNTLNQLEKTLSGKQMYQLKRLVNEIENQKRNGGSSDIIRQLENELFGLISKFEGGEVNGEGSLKKELKQLEHEIEGKNSKAGLLNILPRQLDLDNTLNQLEKELNGKQMYQLKRLINEIENQKRNGGSSDIIRQLENELFGLISRFEGGEVNGESSLKKELKQLEHEIEGKDSKSGLLNILPRQLDLDLNKIFNHLEKELSGKQMNQLKHLINEIEHQKKLGKSANSNPLKELEKSLERLVSEILGEHSGNEGLKMQLKHLVNQIENSSNGKSSKAGLGGILPATNNL